MNWAEHAIRELKLGRVVLIRPKGNSMEPRIKSGAEVILSPIANTNCLKKDDVVLVTIGRNTYLHLISAIDQNRVQISNNKGYINGWASKNSVHGIAISIINK